MKKKGLIIATIVMVLVLAVSLTTATYAWFTVSDVTTLDPFTVKVVANNAVNIGLLKEYAAYNAETISPDLFVYGDCNYTHTTPGQLGGTWEGSKGLGAEITHNIAWGAQKKAVGASSVADATYGTTSYIVDPSGKYLVAANGTNGDDGELENVALAVANNNVDENSQAINGDYVHMVLGVQPTKTLTTNQLVILLTPDAEDATTTFGILAAIRVAYRVNGGTWKEGEFFADKNYNEVRNNYQGSAVTADVKTAYGESYKDANGDAKTFPTTAADAVVITIPALTATDIAQVEIIIYIAGADKDCNNSALGTVGHFDLFFLTK